MESMWVTTFSIKAKIFWDGVRRESAFELSHILFMHDYVRLACFTRLSGERAAARAF